MLCTVREVTYHNPEEGHRTYPVGTPCERVFDLESVSDMTGAERNGIRGSMVRHKDLVCVRLDGKYRAIDKDDLNDRKPAAIGTQGSQAFQNQSVPPGLQDGIRRGSDGSSVEPTSRIGKLLSELRGPR